MKGAGPDVPAVEPNEQWDVFLSYRRKDGCTEARLLKAGLGGRGIRVFLDVDDLGSGHFDAALLHRIEEIPSFVVVLSRRCLDRCRDEDDWLRREIAHAIDRGRKIVPVMLPGFQFPPAESLPPDIRPLLTQQSVLYSYEYFPAMLEKLVEYLHGTPAPVPLAPGEPETSPPGPPPPPEHRIAGTGTEAGKKESPSDYGSTIELGTAWKRRRVLVYAGGATVAVLSPFLAAPFLRDRDSEQPSAKPPRPDETRRTPPEPGKTPTTKPPAALPASTVRARITTSDGEARLVSNLTWKYYYAMKSGFRPAFEIRQGVASILVETRSLRKVRFAWGKNAQGHRYSRPLEGYAWVEQRDGKTFEGSISAHTEVQCTNEAGLSLNLNSGNLMQIEGL